MNHTARYDLLRWLLPALLILVLATAASAEEAADPSVADQVEDLKRKVIDINRELFILEEDLLFPASTQFSVFVSLDTGQFLKLDSVKLKVDGEVVASHLYTRRQLDALKRGALQRLHIGNLKQGEHEITAFVEGLGPENRPYKKATTQVIEKGTGKQALEIRIRDRSGDYQPAVEIVAWE